MGIELKLAGWSRRVPDATAAAAELVELNTRP